MKKESNISHAYGVCLTDEAIEQFKESIIEDFLFFEKYLACETVDTEGNYLRVIAIPPNRKQKLQKQEFLIPHNLVLFIASNVLEKNFGS